MDRFDTAVKAIVNFRDERDWLQFHTPENLAKSISIEAAELLECFQWNVDSDFDAVKSEIADVLTYCILLCEILGIDAIEIIEQKLEVSRIKYPVVLSKGVSSKYDKLSN